jgi:hypothetical protein
MDEWLKISLGALGGLIAGLLAEPIKYKLQIWLKVRDAQRILYKDVIVQVDQLFSIKKRTAKILAELIPLPERDPTDYRLRSDYDDQAAMARMADDIHLLPVASWLGELNTDLFNHYYGGDKSIFYRIRYAAAIKLFYHQIEHVAKSKQIHTREQGATVCEQIEQMIRDLIACVQNDDKRSGLRKALHDRYISSLQ